jgi:hypothetical protein
MSQPPIGLHRQDFGCFSGAMRRVDQRLDVVLDGGRHGARTPPPRRRWPLPPAEPRSAPGLCGDRVIAASGKSRRIACRTCSAPTTAAQRCQDLRQGIWHRPEHGVRHPLPGNDSCAALQFLGAAASGMGRESDPLGRADRPGCKRRRTAISVAEYDSR